MFPTYLAVLAYVKLASDVSYREAGKRGFGKGSRVESFVQVIHTDKCSRKTS